ncbi:MAG TPA: cellulase family glycosylhydrolase [Candidatus Acidoferrales bacterium]|nr:cellulase family glycosylhydrolase [Candidatus Acidoferrales bacterium]
MSAFLLGVNYWPRRSAMYMWERFDLGEIREDMAHIKELGLDMVRFFLRWDDFQPEARRMDAAMLRRFDAMMDAIADAGLCAIPTLFCGHMSGVNWLPSWSLDPSTPHGRFRTVAHNKVVPYGIGDFYHDPALLGAQEFFAQAVGERARAHPALYAWDLGNEFSNLREPKTPEDAAAWSARLTYVLRESSGGSVTGGTHGEDVERDRHLRPSSLAAPWTIATMHGYSVYATFSRGRLDTEVVPFYAQLMQSFTGKPLLFSEFGNPEYYGNTDEEIAGYAEAVLERLHAIGTIGAMWWCWADYVNAMRDVPPCDQAPHELTFGITRADGSERPVARALQKFAAQRRPVLDVAPPIADETSFYASLPEGIDALYRRYRG